MYCWKVISLWHFFSFLGDRGVGERGVDVDAKGFGDGGVIGLG